MAMSVERPYLGTRPFLRADRSHFFGRAAEAADLAELWRANRLTILYGHSGSGKTSLLNAGVLPLVAGGNADVLSPGRVSFGATFPEAALPAHNPYTLAVLRSWSPGETVTRLVGLSVQEFVSRRAERRGGVILAAIDQAEELLADSGPRRRHSQRFLAEVAEALRDCPGLHLLLSVREETIDLLAEALGSGARYGVSQLSVDRALEAVTGPADGAGRPFAAGAAEKLVTSLLTSPAAAADGGESTVILEHVEPALLQVVCARLWESLPVDVADITERDVRSYGDADTALAAHCGRVIAAIADDNDMRAARLRSWLLGTFVTEHGTRGTVYEGMTDTAGMPNAVARALEDRHLLSAERRSGSRWYQLLSDRLTGPLRSAVDERPPPVEPAEYVLSAERALTLGQIDLAERYAKDALHALPDTDLRQRGEVESLLGNLATERGKPGDAEGHHRAAARLLEAVQDTEAVASQLAAVGQTLLAQGQPADAVEELRAATDRIPHDPVVQTELGWALWELGQSRAAVDVLTSVLAIDGGNPAALRARGEILADLGDAREALRDLDRVQRHDRPSTCAARGLARAELGDWRGDGEIERALADAPRNGPVLLYAARTEALGGNKAAALELARRALNATDPAPPPHQREAALTLLGQSRNGRQ
jgi:tetratricopeptide (TPR) repeat protein